MSGFLSEYDEASWATFSNIELDLLIIDGILLLDL